MTTHQGVATRPGVDDGAARIDRGSIWLDLLRDLTGRREDWLAWKGYDSAIDGDGDVDSVAPLEAWTEVTKAFVAWAGVHSLSPVVICPHAPGLLHMLALPEQEDLYFELDVNRRKVFLGSTLFRPADLLPLAYVDDHGVRRLRPGAEGVLKLIQNGMSRGARVRWADIERKGIRESLRSDPDGIAQVSTLFGSGGQAIRRGARAVIDGRWDRPAMAFVEAHALARSVLEPDAVAWRLRFRRQRHRCPVLRSVFDGARRVPVESRGIWLRDVASYGGHVVIDPPGGS